ncbi:MAG: hypothetical protein JWM02_510 [Frankiales bacterium]|nr:hypothetical protein [Frankiales bacterium]
MVLRLPDLWLRDNGLGLRLLVESGETEPEVTWVATTELPDPRPWLAGGELVLTTGLKLLSARSQKAFVERVTSAGASALGFATALTHPSVPTAVLEAARECGLAVLDVPYETPFIAISRWVGERIAADHYAELTALLDAHASMAGSLVSTEGMTGLLAVLRRLTSAPVAVIDAHGQVLDSQPTRATWPVEQIIRDGGSDLRVVPIEVGGMQVAFLCSRAEATHAELLHYAAPLLALELARRQAVLAGRRELVGQVIEDLARGTLTPEEVERRLPALDIEAGRAHRVVLGQVTGGVPAWGALRWGIEPLHAAQTFVSGVITGGLVVLVPDDQPAAQIAQRVWEHLREQGPGARVGIGGAYVGANGIRWSYFEARDALARGPGVHDEPALNLPRLLLANPHLPVHDLAAQVLQPLLDADARSGSCLVETLRAWFDAAGSVRATGERLFVHRNTVRYRLAKVEELLGRPLSDMHHQLELSLALTALTMAAGGPPAVHAPDRAAQ